MIVASCPAVAVGLANRIALPMKDPLRWILLIHQIPPEPLYLRAKIRRRLTGVGAIALKNSVYVLPRREETLEDFEWITQEIVAGGGEAFVCEASFVGVGVDARLVARFDADRGDDYERLAAEMRKDRRSASRAGTARTTAAEVLRLRKQLSALVKIDFFGAPARRKAEGLLAEVEKRSAGRSSGGMKSRYQRRVWATRRGVHIDRIASAWLIRRFLDPEAKFRFIDPKEERSDPDEIRFDMVGGDFTHEGDRCTFETLERRLGLRDPALAAVAEIVHDIDLKDGKFGRPEAAGVEQLILGIVRSDSDDGARLDRGFDLFDDLHRSFQKRRPAPALDEKRRKKKGRS